MKQPQYSEPLIAQPIGFTEAPVAQAYAQPGAAQFGGKAIPPLATVVAMDTARRPACNDKFFAIAFFMNVAAVIAVAATYGREALGDLEHGNGTAVDVGGLTSHQMNELLVVCAGLGVLAIAMTFIMIRMMLRHGENMIRCMLYVFYAQLLLAAAVFVYAGAVIGAAICGGILMLALCAFRNIESRIKFAAANLRVACLAVNANLSLISLAVAKKFFAAIWCMTWVVAFLGVYDNFTTTKTDPESGDLIVTVSNTFIGPALVMFTSLVWGKMALAYGMHCTTAGVVASWWFQPQERTTVGPSLRRTMTTSLGSVSFAALVIAILETISTVLRAVKNNQSNNAGVRIMACLAECMLNCIESLVRYFNKYAIAYCGIYGDSFCQAGGKVRKLFAKQFWDSVANESIIDWAFSLACFSSGVVCAGAGAGAGFVLDHRAHDMSTFLAVIGFIMGYFFMYIQCGILTSGIVTVYICFAENKDALMVNHPEEYSRLVAAWQQKHQGCLLWFGGALGGAGFGV